jgi:hypothetical protein
MDKFRTQVSQKSKHSDSDPTVANEFPLLGNIKTGVTEEGAALQGGNKPVSGWMRSRLRGAGRNLMSNQH